MARFYVYTLTDPRDGEVFYVGKGSGHRIDDHEAEARKGVHSRKCRRIRDIWDDGHKVQKAIASWHEDENAALSVEQMLIAKIGLDNLTNVLPGGVMDGEAYLARQAETERRRQEKEKAEFDAGFVRLAPTFARAFRAIQETGGFGSYEGGRWQDCSECFQGLFWDIVNTIGFDRARDVMQRHGVDMVRRADGPSQPQA